jgi:hypothetical protein
VVSDEPSKQARIAAYKSILREALEQRPSGMRQKIARVLGTHKSFISQITNPGDPTPIPSRHLETIIDVCHLSLPERTHFLAAYGRAHPEYARPQGAPSRHYRTLHLQVPALPDPVQQEALEAFIRDTVRRLCGLFRTQNAGQESEENEHEEVRQRNRPPAQ